MSGFFASGHAVDVVVAVMLVEAVLLYARRRRGGVGIVLTFLPGLLILLGLRAALVGAAWPLVALPLALSFPVHLADLRVRGLFGR